MYLTKEIFVIPEGESYLLYAPLQRKVMRINGGVISLLNRVKAGEEPQDPVLGELVREGIVKEEEEIEAPAPEKDFEFKPTSVTLFPTIQCNLRCVYCHSSAGERQITMEWPVAKSAIDLIVSNALREDKKRIHLALIGGGEPFHPSALDLVKRAVEYGKNSTSKSGLRLTISGSTNGLLSASTQEWIVDYLSNIQVSMDGPAEIQNKQRPTAGGGPSYDLVMETIKYLEERNFKYSIRSTITQESVEKMPEILDFFMENTSLKSFHFEPLSESGRCLDTGYKAPDPLRFLSKFIETSEKAEKSGIRMRYSNGDIDSLKNSFCGAAGKNFVVISDGNVTSCNEIDNKSNTLAEEFFIGYFNHGTGTFEFNEPALKNLANRKLQNLRFCGDCFIKYHCGGDCLAKVARSGSLLDPSNNPRCLINRGIGLYNLKRKLGVDQNEYTTK